MTLMLRNPCEVGGKTDVATDASDNPAPSGEEECGTGAVAAGVVFRSGVSQSPSGSETRRNHSGVRVSIICSNRK